MQVSNWGSVEPTSLDELQALAKEDLGKLDPGVLLKWAMIQARLAGRAALAQQTLVNLENKARDLLYRRLMPVVDEAVMATMVEHRVTEDHLAAARAEYEEMVACQVGAEKVMALIERALRHRAARKSLKQQQRPKAA